MNNYLKDLNEAQQIAVKDYQGPCLVIAGAGSGKTRVLTYRTAYLLKLGVKPSGILALTFTNKAAREMKERIGQLVGNDLVRNLWMGTFHSIFARILRLEGQHLGYPSSYTIYDTTDTKNVLKTIIRNSGLDDQIYKPGEIQSRISYVKNNLITPNAYIGNRQLTDQDKRSRRPKIADIYMTYAHICKKSNAMDFDDLLLNTFLLFRDFPKILTKYQQYYKYILVDEYQDTNYVQYRIINQLAAIHRNICVVGDDAQSIYSFRGARIENILNFQNDYPDYKLYKLEQNYRSTKTIVKAANSLISKNQYQISKKVWSGNENGEKVRLLQAATDNEEGYLVTNLVQDTIYTEQLQYNDFAILYRTNAQSRIFEESFRKLNIPYKVYGSLSFYQRKEIKDLLAYFRLVVNPYDEEALTRIINYPARGIGDRTFDKLTALSHEKDIRIWDILTHIDKYDAQFNKGTIRKLADFVELITRFIRGLKRMEAFDLAFTIADSTGILKDLHYEKSPENLSKYENIQELLNGIKEFTDSQTEKETATLDAFLQNIALLTDADTEKDEDKNKVTIMTIHSAKGLEFKHVFITGLEEDLFPSRLSSTTREELEEERRLFYVALTRAMKKVTLSYAESRYKWGVLINCTPSRFLREIDETYLEIPYHTFLHSNSDSKSEIQYSKQPNSPENHKPDISKPFVPRHKRSRLVKINEITGNSNSRDNFQPDDSSKIQVGMEVEHPRFGKGKVINMEGEFPNRKATVFFKDTGQKQLLLKFAKLRIIKY